MQKQKTIAKWLAVILLTTVAIACYIVFDATQTSKPSNTVVGAQSGNEQPVTPKPVYTTYPRLGETVDGISVSHFGGSDEDAALDAINFVGKTLLISMINSTDHDVKESGLYIAVLCKNTLEKSIKIADENVTYLTCVLQKNGLLIFYCDSEKTSIVLLKNDLSIGGRGSMDAYSQITALSLDNCATLFCVSGNELCLVTINETLDCTKSNFVYQGDEISIKKAIEYKSNHLLFVQNGDDINTIIYNAKTGFNNAFSLYKHTLLQIMPISQSGEQAFVILSSNGENLRLDALSSNLSTTANTTISQGKNAVLLQDDIGIKVLCQNTIYRYCAHLDYIDEQQLSTPVSQENVLEYQCIEGEKDIFVIRRNDGFELYKLQGNSPLSLAKAKTASSPIIQTNCVQNSRVISLLFSCNSQNDFSYMSFGKNDVFYLSLTA